PRGGADMARESLRHGEQSEGPARARDTGLPRAAGRRQGEGRPRARGRRLMGFARAWALAAGLAWCCAAYSEDPLQLWTERFRFREPPVSTEGICAGTVGGLPGFTVHPEASGPRLVRVSL